MLEVEYTEEDIRETFNSGYRCGAEATRKALERPPAHWLGNYTPYPCSECGKYSDTRTNYCPHCGSKMS